MGDNRCDWFGVEGYVTAADPLTWEALKSGSMFDVLLLLFLLSLFSSGQPKEFVCTAVVT